MTNKKSGFSEKLKKFARKMRNKQITTNISADNFKSPTLAAAVKPKPKKLDSKDLTERTLGFIEKRVVIKDPETLKETDKKAPKAAPKETPTKTLDETELQNKFKAETGKNAIWRGQETKVYIEWKQKQLAK